MHIQTNRQPDSVHDLRSGAPVQPGQPRWHPLFAILDHLQRHKQMAAGQLLLSGYRPLAFVLQQSLYFLMPLALLLGFSPTPVVLGREDEYACAANGAEESQ